MSTDPQQELFSALLVTIKEQGYDVYDGAMPPVNTPYPFVYLADSQQIDDENKSAIFGSVYQTIHVWHNSPTKRGTISAMIGTLKSLCRQLHYTPSFAWNVSGVDQRILTDTTTASPLLHGVLYMTFKFCGR